MKERLTSKLIKATILKRFFEIPLTSVEYEMAWEAVDLKYRRALISGALYAICLIPALLLLETEIVVSVLIPTTMVAGTAWFAVSLASMKKKFEAFGTELTTDLFVAFTLSLMMLFLATAFSLTTPVWIEQVRPLKANPLAVLASATLALVVVGKLLFSIFSGSLKYDVNDAMLTGQNEAAERFFKKSLSLLHGSSEALKLDRGLQVANYTIGVAFFEIFNNIKEVRGGDIEGDLDKYINEANRLIKNPEMTQKAADKIASELIREFLKIVNSAGSVGDNVSEHKSYKAVLFELDCLEKNEEDQQMVDTRMSVIFSEISNLMETFGNQLFGEAAGAAE